MAESFLGELKRRNVFRVAAIYLVVGWLLMQVGDVMFPALRLPDWTSTLLAAFLILGLPLALLFAWAFELTPDGVVRTSEVPAEQSITADTGRRINYMIIGVLAVAVAFLLIKDQLRPDVTTPAAVPGALDRSIAVLPFKNQSASAENAEFFAGGLHDELLTLLSRIGDLRVISRTSVERLDPGLSVQEIGQLLNVATVLEGQVQRAGDRLRINVQLIDTTAEGHLWANTYDSALTAENVFDVQSSIARTIADALHAELSPAEEALLGSVPTTSTEALEKYLLGVQLWKRQTYSALSDAVVYLTEATTLDPGFAAAWVALAKAYTSAHQTGAITTEEFIAGAEPAVENAMRIDPLNAAAHTQQAVLQWARGDLEGAQRSFEQALAIDDRDSVAVGEYAYFLRNSFRAEEAIPLVEKALENDPLSIELLFQLGKAHMHAGRPERFLELTKLMREIDPSVIHAYTGTLQAYLWMGEVDEATKWFVKSLEHDPLDYENWAHMAIHLNELGDPETADRALQRAGEIGPGEPAVLKSRVIIHIERGENEAAARVARDALAADLDDRWGSDWVFVRAARDAALDAGNAGGILDLYRERVPRALAADPVVEFDALGYAVDAIAVLHALGEDEQADMLAEASLELYERINPKRIRGYDTSIMDIEILALMGRTDSAIERLQQAVDNGWHLYWRYHTASRNLDSIREQPEFRAALARLEARTAEQAARWHATPHLGENDLRDTESR